MADGGNVEIYTHSSHFLDLEIHTMDTAVFWIEDTSSDD